jgi:hypothetical protein
MSENKSAELVRHQTAIERRGQMHPLVSAALNSGGLTPETIRELLTLQKAWEADEARKAFTRDLTMAKGELPSVIPTDRQNDRLRCRYTTLAKLLDVVTVVLARHGFSIGGGVEHRDDMLHVTTTLTHRQGHQERITLPCKPEGIHTRDGKAVLSPEQTLGKTITYLRRYGLATILGIASGDMPDADDQSSARINTAKNQKAVSRLAELGIELCDAEKQIGHPWVEWTGEDLQALANWMRPKDDGDA